MQVGAFKDFTPGSQASGARAVAAQEEPEEEDEGDSPPESSEGAGDYPPHTVMGLPALSPTMSQGTYSSGSGFVASSVDTDNLL